jgi:uncharacterized protein with beta-barrel porin domain
MKSFFKFLIIFANLLLLNIYADSVNVSETYYIDEGVTLKGYFVNASTTVESSGTLRGTGTLGAVTNNGTVAPGASIGTLTVAGNYTQTNGSTLATEFNSALQTDLLDITGIATIQTGSTLQLLPEVGSYIFGSSYTFLRAAGGKVGTFDTISVTNETRLGGLNINLDYSNLNAISFTLGCSNTFMINLNSTLAQKIVTQRSDNITKHFEISIYEDNPCYTFFEKFKEGQIHTYFEYSSKSACQKETPNNRAGKYELYSPLIGFDYLVTENFLLGGIFNLIIGKITESQDQGKINSDSYGIGIYTQYKFLSQLFGSLSLSGGCSDYNIKHNVSTGVRADAKTDGYDVSARAEINPLICGKWLSLKPNIAIQLLYARIDQYTERNGTYLLKVYKDNFTSVQGELGTSIFSSFLLKSFKILPSISFNLVKNIKNTSRNKKAIITNSSTDVFVKIDKFKEFYAKLEGSILMQLKNKVILFLDANTLLFADEKKSIGYRAGLQVVF